MYHGYLYGPNLMAVVPIVVLTQTWETRYVRR